MEKQFNQLASEESINATRDALVANGVDVIIVDTGEDAKKKALEMIPMGAEVMNMQSVTLSSIGLADELNVPGKYNSVRNTFATMDGKVQGQEMKKLGAAPEWTVGSAHAVTEDGKVIVASATGSQLPAYAYGASHLIWIVGSQKIVKDLDEGMKRIEEYVFPLENERAMKAYGKGSGINKLFILNKEVMPGRITMIIVKQQLGF